MAGRDIDLLARKLVTLERQQTANSRATQLALSSVRLLDGSSVAISSGLEDSEGTAEDLGILNEYTEGIAGSLDEAIDFNDNVFGWIDSSKDAAEIGWDATEYAVDLANELEVALAAANGELDQAKLDLEQAEIDIAQAKQDIIDAQQAADDAQETADQAITSADGKNTIYYSDLLTPPTAPAGGFKEGDTWFAKIDNGGVPETIIARWGGTQWIQGVALGTLSIVNAAITDAKIANIDAAKITTGYLNANRIEALSITAGKLAADSVTADKIVSNAVTADKIAADSITGDKIVGNTITGDKLVALTITADKIAANAITAGKIQAQAIDGMTITGALIRTAPGGQRMEFDVNGLRAFNDNDAVTASLASATGGLNVSLIGSNGRTGGIVMASETHSATYDTSSVRVFRQEGSAQSEARIWTATLTGVSKSAATFSIPGANNQIEIGISNGSAPIGGVVSSSTNLYLSGVGSASLQASSARLSGLTSTVGIDAGTSINMTANSNINMTPGGNVTLNPTGPIRLNSDITSNRQPTILWSGAIFMNGNQTANFSANVSDQLSGIVLVWSAYADGAAQNSSWNHVFIPKNQVQYASSAGVLSNIYGWKTSVWKYVYLYNNRITGHADNSASPNNTQVLRYVIGV